MRSLRCCGIILLAVSVVSAVSLNLPALFSDNMVLQRDRPIAVWGSTSPRARVSVSLGRHTAKVRADRMGTWDILLQPLAAGGPYVLSVVSTDTLTFRNVMLGDVWLCSGQSNMEMGIEMVNNAQQEIDSADFPDIRLFTVGKVAAKSPQDTTQGQWLVCTPENIREGHWNGFSAVSYFFGRDIHRTQNVPVGLLHSSWGGTPAESWIGLAALKKDPRLKPVVDKRGEILRMYPALQGKYLKRMAAWDSVAGAKAAPVMLKDSGNKGFDKGWARPDFDDRLWEAMNLPCFFEPTLPIDGAVWFRREVRIPEVSAGKDLILSLGTIDDFDVTYYNGRQIGATGQETPHFWETRRQYVVPASLVRKGRAVVAVRVFDHYGQGGFGGIPEQMFLSPTEGKAIPLSGAWKYKEEFVVDPAQTNPSTRPSAPLGPQSPLLPTGLYNGMIAPLTRLAIRGAIWYQGESNTGGAERYHMLLRTLIESWREQWKDQFPFLIVQLTNYMSASRLPSESGWALVRAAQADVAEEVPGCGLACTIDIGDSTDIHPRNKQEVGRRLGLVARRIVYKDVTVPSGPRFSSVSIDGNVVRVSFKDADSGIVVRGDTPGHFALAGADRRFFWAHARLEGATVVLSSDRVPEPVAVRYGWADNPSACNLFSKEGLPAVPFRTDRWDVAMPGVE